MDVVFYLGYRPYLESKWSTESCRGFDSLPVRQIKINFKGSNMNAIKMNRAELLEIVRANMAMHVTDFSESVNDYKKLVLKLALANAKLAKTGDLEQFKNIKGMPQSPVSYEDSYKRAIRMLELSIDEVIEVNEDVFSQLVLDEWVWKRQFTVANTMYKTASF